MDRHTVGCCMALCLRLHVHFTTRRHPRLHHPIDSIASPAITTIEAIGATLAAPRSRRPPGLDRRWQCGYCQSAILSATAPSSRAPHPTDTYRRPIGSVNICRCCRVCNVEPHSARYQAGGAIKPAEGWTMTPRTLSPAPPGRFFRGAVSRGRSTGGRGCSSDCACRSQTPRPEAAAPMASRPTPSKENSASAATVRDADHALFGWSGTYPRSRC